MMLLIISDPLPPSQSCLAANLVSWGPILLQILAWDPNDPKLTANTAAQMVKE